MKSMSTAFLVACALLGRIDSALAFLSDASRPGEEARCQFSTKKCLSQCKAHEVPSVEELASDPFIKQVFHSEKLVQMLATDPEGEGSIAQLLKAQLGHSDGIRGFFVTYLTMASDNSPADWPQIPLALLTALQESANEKELVSLACMNVIMPTAMITMHKDAELSKQSQKTAERGVRVLRALRGKPLVQEECKAIADVANTSAGESSSADASKLDFWEQFFDNWGYKEIQKRDIAQAVKSVLA